jgi:hypothetical protein
MWKLKPTILLHVVALKHDTGSEELVGFEKKYKGQTTLLVQRSKRITKGIDGFLSDRSVVRVPGGRSKATTDKRRTSELVSNRWLLAKTSASPCSLVGRVSAVNEQMTTIPGLGSGL